jgi:tRNA threonylcarbamoyladenosine biosynthesis protein TsaE
MITGISWQHGCYSGYFCTMELGFSLNNIKEIATRFWKEFPDSTVFAFHGAMGVGKTTFIHALCDIRNVKDVVGSPTFSIINEYVFTENAIEKKIFHIDLYRLTSSEEAIRAGVEDCFYSDHICFVEWPEKSPEIFPAGTIHVYLELVDSETRRLKIANK